MKYRDNLTKAEIDQLKAELQLLEDAYASAAEHDAAQPRPKDDEDYEDPSDYVGMGWIDSRGRP